MRNHLITKMGGVTLAVLSLICLLVLETPATADTTTYTLNSPNAALSCCTGPYDIVTVERTDTTHATITFDSQVNGGYFYLIGDGSTAGVNVNATTFTLTGITGTNSLVGFTPGAYSVANPPGTSNVNGFGLFNGVVDSDDGFTHSSTQIFFTLTNTSGTWASAADVLLANATGSHAEVHSFACATSFPSPATPCDSTTGAFATGFAADGTEVVPEPASLLLLGSGLAGLGLWRRMCPK